MHRLLLVLSLVLAPALAGRAEAPKRSHAITVADYFTLSTLFQSVLAPDGSHVAYTEGRWQKSADARKADLWVVEVEGKKIRRLTFARANDSAPVWSPDSKTIYFLGRRKRDGEKQPPYDGSNQVWRVGRDGGDGDKPFAVTRVAGGVEAFDLAADGKSLFYQVNVGRAVEGAWKDLRQQFKGIEYGHGTGKKSQLWRLDLTGWRAEKLCDDGRVVREFKVAPGGKALALITTPDDKVVSFEGQSRVDVFDLQTKKTVTLPDKCYRAGPSPYAWLEALAWNGNGTALAFNAVFDAYPAEVVVATNGAGGWQSSLLKRPEGLHVRGYGSPLAWRGESDLLFLGERKAHVHLYEARNVGSGPAPPCRNLTPGDLVIGAFTLNRDGGLAAVLMADATSLPDLYLTDTRGKIELTRPTNRLTHLNPQADTWKLPKVSIVSWKGANGDTVEGILELPPDGAKGEKLPLVIGIHGGPTTAVYARLSFEPWQGQTFLAVHGYALLCPNYRGSTGYGDKFLTDLVGHENDVDVADILAGVDALVERGIADPKRLGVMGWSNGGYLTNCCITHTTRFKAASSGAGIVDTVTEWGTNDEPAYAMVFKKGLPWNRVDLYKKASPLYGLDKVRTPTLIHVGGADERCPPGHSRMLYRALKEYVKVPAELLVYPGEPHGLMKYTNREAKMRWDLAWFNRYIRGVAAGGKERTP